ncbi:MAG: AzlD domain-containing protein [Xanthobacteraceae bacterium]
MTLRELAPYLILIFAGFLPHEAWRWVGIVLSRGLDETSEVIVWVRAVAVAILAGVVGKIVVFSPGALAGVPLWVRLSAAAAGMLAFFLTRQSVLVGVATGTGCLVLAQLVLGR